jgi:hypothetical protein
MGGELWRNGIIDLWALYQVIKQDSQKDKINMLLAAIENNKLSTILYTKSYQGKTLHPDDVANPRAAALRRSEHAPQQHDQ